MIAAAIVCAAVVGQAAQVVWGCDWAYSDNGTTINTYDDGSAVNYWIVDMGTATDTSGLSIDGSGNLVNKDGYSLIDTGSMPEAYGGGTLENDSLANGNYLAMVIYDAANGLYGVSDANQISGIVLAPPTQGSLSAAFANDGAGSMVANIATASVPEPTSGLLMFLGVVGLALRRRRV